MFVNDLLVEGEIRGRSRDGEDNWFFNDTEFQERLRLDTGAGSDYITIFGPNDNNAGEQMDFRTGDGDDFIGVEYGGSLEMNVNTGAGDDDFEIYLPVSELNVRSGSGDDLIYLSGDNSALATDLNVRSGSGDDVVDIFKWTLSDAEINTGSDNDEIVIGFSTAESELEARLGSGEDMVRLVDNDFDYDVRMGSGNDEVFLDDMSGEGELNGNSGIDFLDVINSTFPEISNFENTP